MNGQSPISYLRYLLISDNGRTMYVNGNFEMSYNLPPLWRTPEDIYGAVLDACEKFQIDYADLSESTIINRIKEAVEAMTGRKGANLAADSKQSQPNPELENPIDLTEDLTREITFDEVAEILSTTIKKDDSAKLVTFAAGLLAQTGSDQINIGFQSKSSTGKSYIPVEVTSYFPSREVVIIASASPTAFFHDRGIWDKERKVLVVDLEGKILVFLDQPHFQLLERLGPFLSHDRKELEYKITDKSQKHGLATKNVVIRGYASVFFCTTRQDLDDQEKTRLILLSPSIEQDKLMESVHLISLRKGNPAEYDKSVKQDPRRRWLMDRIKGIRQLGIKEVIIPDHGERVCKRFIERHPYLTPRHQRDFPRIISLIKAHALLNSFNREKVKDEDGNETKTIMATQTDIDAGFRLYEAIADSNEHGLSPYVYDVYEKVIKPQLGSVGIRREDVQRKYYEVYHEPLSMETLKREIIPQLELVGLIYQESDPQDRRRLLIYPPVPPPNSSEPCDRGNDSGDKGQNLDDPNPSQ